MRFLPLSLHVSRSVGIWGKKKREWRRSSRDKHNGKSLMETLYFLHYTRRERSCLRTASLFGKIAFSLSNRLALPPAEDRTPSFRAWSKLYYDINELIGFKNTPCLSPSFLVFDTFSSLMPGKLLRFPERQAIVYNVICGRDYILVWVKVISLQPPLLLFFQPGKHYVVPVIFNV